MQEPQNITELRRFLGMTTQLSKFTPCLSDTTKPLRDMLSAKNTWIWDEPHSLLVLVNTRYGLCREICLQI